MVSRYEGGKAPPTLARLDALIRIYGRTWHDVADAVSGPRDPVAILEDKARQRILSDPAQAEIARRLGIAEEVVMGALEKVVREQVGSSEAEKPLRGGN